MGTSKNLKFIFKNPTQTNFTTSQPGSKLSFCPHATESKWEGFIGIEVFRSSHVYICANEIILFDKSLYLQL